MGRTLISIHPMLWFFLYLLYQVRTLIKFQYIQCYGSSVVGVGLKCRPNIFQYIQCYGSSQVKKLLLNLCRISIHPMLWFFLKVTSRPLPSPQFQYIQCYGSSEFFELKELIGKAFQYIQCYGSSHRADNLVIISRISIHPMLWFFMCLDGFEKLNPRFQYIQCYGSSK